MGGFGEGEAVADDAGAAVAEAADVCGVEDGGAVIGDHAVAGEGASEVVSWQDFEGEAGVALTGGVGGGGRGRGEFGGVRWEVDAEEGGEGIAGGTGEVGEEDGLSGGGAEGGVGEAEEVIGMDPGDACEVAVGGFAAVRVVGRPEAIGAGVEEGEFDVRAGDASESAEGPVGIEAKGEFAITLEFAAGEFSGFEEVENDEVKEGFVGRGTAGPVLLEMGQSGEPEIVRRGQGGGK